MNARFPRALLQQYRHGRRFAAGITTEKNIGAEAKGKNAWDEPLNPSSWKGDHFGWLVVGISGVTCYAILKVWGRGKQRERDEGYLGADRTDKK